MPVSPAGVRFVPGGWSVSDARALVREAQTGRVAWLSKGALSFTDVLEAVTLEAPPGGELWLGTWSVGPADVGQLGRLVEAARPRVFRLIVDYAFPKFRPVAAALLQRRFGLESIRAAQIHAKVGVYLVGDRAWVLRGSANMTRNPRLEFFELEDDRGLAAGIIEAFAAWFDLVPAVGYVVGPELHEKHDRWTIALAKSLEIDLEETGPYGRDVRRAGLSYV